MRVLMVTPSYYPIKGGAETVVRNLSINLNKKGIHTDIMTFNMDKKWHPHWQAKVERTENFDVLKVPGLNWFPLEHSDRITLGINIIPGRFREYVRKYEIIHFHVGDLTFPLFSWMIKKPKIIQLHSPLVFYTRYLLSRIILKKTADAYIAISKQMQKELIALEIEPKRIRYVPNGVNTEIFQPSKEKEDNLLLFVGRITFGKGLHVLLKSLRHLKTKVHLVIIGPSDWDFEYFKEIIQLIEHENKRGNHKITYLGAQEQSVVLKWCQKASIFVSPSFREAFPVTLLEAMSCETPIVATSVGAIPEIVINGETGIIVPPNNVAALKEALEYLLENESIRRRMAQIGRKRVMDYFSYEVVIDKLCGLYSDLLQLESTKVVE